MYVKTKKFVLQLNQIKLNFLFSSIQKHEKQN